MDELVLEVFDLDKARLIKEPTISRAMEQLGYKNAMSYSFTSNGTEYIVHRFDKNGAMEFHFVDWTNANDLGTNTIKRYDVSSILASVLGAIYINRMSENAKVIRICFTKNRERSYLKIFEKVQPKYFSAYRISKQPYFYEKAINPETKESEDIWAFEITRGDYSKTVPVKTLKEWLLGEGFDLGKGEVCDIKF